jgi:hypothetical protein
VSMLVDIFSGEFLKSEKVFRSKNKSLMIMRLHWSPKISRAVLIGHEDRLFFISITLSFL